MRVKTKTSGQGKTGSPKLCLFILVTLVSKDLPTFLGEGNMQTAFVETHSGRYTVKSAKITPYGFTNFRKIDTFRTLSEAQHKAKITNYIFKKADELAKKYHREIMGVK